MHLDGDVLPDVLLDFLEDEGNHFLGNGWTSDSSALEYSYDIQRGVCPFCCTAGRSELHLTPNTPLRTIHIEHVLQPAYASGASKLCSVHLWINSILQIQ